MIVPVTSLIFMTFPLCYSVLPVVQFNHLYRPQRARSSREQGFRAVKFGWESYGGAVELDLEQVAAVRLGLGEEGILMVDVGTVWEDDVEAA